MASPLHKFTVSVPSPSHGEGVRLTKRMNKATEAIGGIVDGAGSFEPISSLSPMLSTVSSLDGRSPTDASLASLATAVDEVAEGEEDTASPRSLTSPLIEGMMPSGMFEDEWEELLASSPSATPVSSPSAAAAAAASKAAAAALVAAVERVQVEHMNLDASAFDNAGSS